MEFAVLEHCADFKHHSFPVSLMIESIPDIVQRRKLIEVIERTAQAHFDANFSAAEIETILQSARNKYFLHEIDLALTEIRKIARSDAYFEFFKQKLQRKLQDQLYRERNKCPITNYIREKSPQVQLGIIKKLYTSMEDSKYQFFGLYQEDDIKQVLNSMIPDDEFDLDYEDLYMTCQDDDIALQLFNVCQERLLCTCCFAGDTFEILLKRFKEYSFYPDVDDQLIRRLKLLAKRHEDSS